MVSLGRKRKGGTHSSSTPVVGRKRSPAGEDDDLLTHKNSRKKCRDKEEKEPRNKSHADADDVAKKAATETAAGAVAGTVMTAPPCGGSSPADSGRGLKRKHGCVDTATRTTGRKKKLEDEYVLGPAIGRGRFGSVSVCRSKVTGEDFACKTLLKIGGESVHREVEVMQHLSGHRGVVTLKEVFEDQDSFHLVMEMCSGGRLLDRMASEGTYSEHHAALLVKEIVTVIKYCHDMGVVHRDVKPENILLTSSGHIKLADFGLAVRINDGQKITGLAGSAAYVAPEVLTGHYSEKVDIWGVGVLLHALLVGVLPFHGDSREAIFEAIKKDELDFHCGLWASVSELARDLISRLLNRDVSTRMTADQVLAHPWISFYTGCPSKASPTKSRTRSVMDNGGTDIRKLVWTESITSSSENSRQKQGESEEEDGFADMLAAAINRITISESKRTRVCSPARLVPQKCSSNLQPNLLAVF